MDRRTRSNPMRDRRTQPDMAPPERVSTGTTGLDEILEGGVLARRRYLLERRRWHGCLCRRERHAR